MRNKLAVLVMAAAVAATMMVGCGSSADTAETVESTVAVETVVETEATETVATETVETEATESVATETTDAE